MPETPEFERVEDKREAEEGAYAEKPYRDASAEYGEKLSPETKQSLDWIASQEAEKAIEQYRNSETSEKETAKEMLREETFKAMELFRQSPDKPLIREEVSVEVGYPPKYAEGWKQKDWDDVIATINELNKKVATGEIEKALAYPEASVVQKNLRMIANRFREVGKDGRDASYEVAVTDEALLARALATEGKLPVEKVSFADHLKEELLREHFELITEVRAGSVGNKVPNSLISVRNENMDERMQKQGYIWSVGEKRYIKT